MKHSKLLMLSQYQNFTQIKRIHIWTKLRAHSRCMHRAQISQVTQIRPNTVQTYASLSSYPLSILIENPQSSTLPTIQQCQASMVRPSKTPLCTHRAQIFWVTQIRLSRVQTYTSLSSHSPFDPLWKTPATQALPVDWDTPLMVRPSKVQLCIHAQSTNIQVI